MVFSAHTTRLCILCCLLIGGVKYATTQDTTEDDDLCYIQLQAANSNFSKAEQFSRIITDHFDQLFTNPHNLEIVIDFLPDQTGMPSDDGVEFVTSAAYNANKNYANLITLFDNADDTVAFEWAFKMSGAGDPLNYVGSGINNVMRMDVNAAESLTITPINGIWDDAKWNDAWSYGEKTTARFVTDRNVMAAVYGESIFWKNYSGEDNKPADSTTVFLKVGLIANSKGTLTGSISNIRAFRRNPDCEIKEDIDVTSSKCAKADVADNKAFCVLPSAEDGNTDLTADGACLQKTAATWFEAQTHCSIELGMRLCRKDEVLQAKNLCTGNNNFAGKPIWVADQCGGGMSNKVIDLDDDSETCVSELDGVSQTNTYVWCCGRTSLTTTVTTTTTKTTTVTTTTITVTTTTTVTTKTTLTTTITTLTTTITTLTTTITTLTTTITTITATTTTSTTTTSTITITTVTVSTSTTSSVSTTTTVTTITSTTTSTTGTTTTTSTTETTATISTMTATSSTATTITITTATVTTTTATVATTSIAPSEGEARDSGGGGGSNVGAIVGAIFAVLFIGLIVAFLVYRYRQNQDDKPSQKPYAGASEARGSKPASAPVVAPRNSFVTPPPIHDADPQEHEEPPIPLTTMRQRKLSIYKKMVVVPFRREEFDHLEKNHSGLDTLPTEIRSNLKKFNRYKNILPNPHSRVMLPILNGDTTTEFINANYIEDFDGNPRGYIAAQGPKPDTIVAFWRMMWEVNSTAIVMVTGLSEGGKEKCARYWPSAIYKEDKGTGGVKHGDMEVQVMSGERADDYKLAVLRIVRGSEHRIVRHYWFDSWPDYGVPKDSLSVPKMLRHVREWSDSPENPWVVHCSAGIGRTGTFIGIDMGIHMLEKYGKANVIEIIQRMRRSRGGMVQVEEQAAFVQRCLEEYAALKNDLIDGKKVKNADEVLYENVGGTEEPAGQELYANVDC